LLFYKQMKIFSIKLCLWIFISLNGSSTFSQNLVPNGNFEQHLSFDKLGNVPEPNIHFLTGWKPSGMDTYWAYCHRDFVKKFGIKSLKDRGYIYFDTLTLFDGDAMVKLDYGENCPSGDTGYASYIKTRLTSPLELGDVYEVSMWVYSGINPAVDTQFYTHVGMYLSRKELFWKSPNRIPTKYYFNSKIIPGQWTQIKWYIRALCSLEYLTIGVFRDDEFPSLFRGDPANDVYYFVDNVVFKKVNEDSLATDTHPTPYCEYYEKEEKTRILESITSLDVNYESNISTLDDKDKMELDSFYQANILRQHKIFIITGHTDSETAENIKLSEARAESVKSYLLQKYNLPEMSLITFGFGSASPVSDNTSSAGRLQNRRTTIRTSDMNISKVIYRKGLNYVKEDSLGKAYYYIDRWLRMVPFAQRVEIVVDPRLNKLKQTKYWNKIINSIRKGYSIYPEAKNAYFLDSMFVEDQVYRISKYGSFGGFIEEIDTLESPAVVITEAIFLQKVDSNFATVQNYLDQNAYPEISKVGRRPARGLWYAILHKGDSMTYVKTLNVLKDLCMQGEAEWDIYAKMADKLSVIKKEPQYYGTQFQIDSHGVHSLYKIDDIEEVNKRRARIGMAPTAIIEN